MSDNEYCFFDDDYGDFYSQDDDEDDDDEDFYDEDLDDHCIYLSGYHDDEDMDSLYRAEKQSSKVSVEQSERKTIYKELSLQDPNELLRNPLSLIDICSRKIALNFPFAYIENRIPPIPENVQLNIIKHSFPQSMEKIKRYCVLNNGSSSEFERAIRTLKNVKDLMQIGFHLSANIETRGYREIWNGSPPGKKSPYLYITIKFDRGKITETHCPCETSSSWCFHVISVCLARIFRHEKCVFKPPLSDSLNNLKSYAELRTFTQYLIAEFSNGRIVESAQNVLDRMLTPRRDENDAISEIWGAPDPTAGPGIDEHSHWLICEEGLKSRCTSMISTSSDITEGYWGLNVAEVGPSSSVMEWWRNFQLDKPVIEDYFCEFSDVAGNPSFSYNYYRQSYSREKSQEISKFLKTCEELLKDDFSYSLKAVQTFTVQLLDVIEERNQRDYYRYDRKVFESNSHLGCIPRPKQCWLFRDQLARLWRLLILNPAITSTKRSQIFTILEVLENKLPVGGSGPNKKQYMQWDSQKHTHCLRNFSWDTLELGENPFKNNNLAEVIIEHCVVVETSQTIPRDDADELTDRFSYPVSLLCGSFSSSVTIFCYMIEALNVYGQTEQAVHLAMAVALSIVRYYNAWLEGELRVSVKTTVCIDVEENETPKDVAPANNGKRGKRTRKAYKKRGRKGGKKAESEKEKVAKKSSKEAIFDEENGIIPITSLAFLLHVLEENEGLVGEMLKLVKVQSRGLADEEMMECDDVTSDARSLIFRLGVVGLAMPKVQAPSLQIQVEWFNWESYITDKVTKSVVTSFDMEFLRKMTSRVIGLCSDGRGFLPPYTLVTALFNHSYKVDPTGKVNSECEDGLTVALETIETSPGGLFGANIQKRMFFESCRRHWVKLAETVVYATTNCDDHLNQVLKGLFSAVAMIGSSEHNIDLTSKPTSSKKPTYADQKVNFIQQMIPEKVVATLYLAHSLVQQADKVRLNEPGTKEKLPGVIPSPSKTERKSYELLVVQGRKMLVKEQPVSDQRRLLYETAIRVCTHAYAVKNRAFHELQLDSYTVEYNFPEFLQRNLRWLCRISNKIDVRAFDLVLERQRTDAGPVKCFNDDEIIRLCTQMLESDQRNQDCVWVMVRDVLLALMKFDNQKKVNDVLTLCRNVEKERPAKRAILFPSICKELLTILPATAVPDNSKLEYLVRAMKLMYTLFKDTELDENQDSLGGVKELFADTSMSPSDKPGTSRSSHVDQHLDINLQLSFDLALETVKYIDEDDRVRGYESRRRFECLCEVVAFVAKKACAKTTTAAKSAAPPEKNEDHKAYIVRTNTPEFEEVYISRFVEALCNTVKDCLLLTDFYFEISSRLLDVSQHGAFGRDKVLVSDDLRVSMLSKCCSSLSVLLKRCIAGLLETTHGDVMNAFLKETNQETKNYLKSRAKHTKFYYGASLVTVLEVLKRLMDIAKDDDFESFSHKLSSKHAVVRMAVEEVNTKAPSSSPREYEDSMLPDDLISSLILRRMLSPALACFDYDSDGWRY